MDTIESAKIKDNLLEYLLARPNKRESLEAFIYKSKLDNKPKAVLRSYVEEMEEDGAIESLPMSLDRLVLTLKPYGEKFLLEDGGYTKQFNDTVSIRQQQEADAELGRKQSRVNIKHTKIATVLSIIAIIISIAALLISIFKS